MFEVPAGCMHAEHVGPEGVALLSGRRRNGGPLTREAFESDLRREGFEVVHGGQKAGFTEELHAHDFDMRIMVLSGEITLTRDNKAETFQAGDHCELAAGCQHSAKVGPEGVAYHRRQGLSPGVHQLNPTGRVSARQSVSGTPAHSAFRGRRPGEPWVLPGSWSANIQ